MSPLVLGFIIKEKGCLKVMNEGIFRLETVIGRNSSTTGSLIVI